MNFLLNEEGREYSYCDIGVECAYCGCDNTHHKKVVVYSRAGEDAEHGRKIEINTNIGNVKQFAKSNMINNPSPRRGGIVIELWCEGCEQTTNLNIYQHKGKTFIDTTVK
jgi:hypothetical protein